MRRRTIGITLFALVVGVAAMAVAIGTSNADVNADGDGDGDEQAGTVEEAPFIGLTKSEASALAESEGRPWRIGREDDAWFAVTADYVAGRVTFELDGGVVTVARGCPDSRGT